MRIPRIYTSQALTENSQVEFSGGSAHYLKNVLRMKVGREVVLFNGDGNEFAALITAVEKKSVAVDVRTMCTPQVESPLSVHLGCCLIKSDRMDWLLQKATELGVTTFSPLISDFSDIKIPQERLAKKMEHWQQVIISACEQSGRTRIPNVVLPQTVNAWMAGLKVAYKAVLHPYRAQRFNRDIKASSIALLVGPEGGFSEDEITMAHNYHFQSLSLGSRILRAETVPLVALSLFQHHLGDL